MNKEFFLFLIKEGYLNVEKLIVDYNTKFNLFNQAEIDFIAKINQYFGFKNPLLKHTILSNSFFSKEETIKVLLHLEKLKIIKTNFQNNNEFYFKFFFLFDYINSENRFLINKNIDVLYASFINNSNYFELIGFWNNKINTIKFFYPEIKENLINGLKNIENFKPDLNFEITYFNFKHDLKALSNNLIKIRNDFKISLSEIKNNDFKKENIIVENLNLLEQCTENKFQILINKIKNNLKIEKNNFFNLILNVLKQNKDIKLLNDLAQKITEFFYSNKYNNLIFNSNFQINLDTFSNIKNELNSLLNQNLNNNVLKSVQVEKINENLLENATNFWSKIYN